MDTSSLRRASAVDGFPYRGQRVTFLVLSKGRVYQAKTLSEKRAALAQRGATVMAAWPGEWSQDIFLVDDREVARTEL